MSGSPPAAEAPALYSFHSGGLAYWQNKLETNLGNPLAVGALILNVISGAQGSDQTTIANKVTVADYFTSRAQLRRNQFYRFRQLARP